MTTPATTVNKVCLSGLDAIAQAADLIRLGEFDVIVAGGMESMTNAPHVLQGLPPGLQVRPGRDARLDGLRRPDRRVQRALDGRVDGTAQRQARHLPRAAGRVRRPLAAARGPRHEGRHARRGDRRRSRSSPSRRRWRRSKTDEGIRADTTAESLRRLRPAFGADGTITAGIGLADLRRRRRRHRGQPGGGRAARRATSSPRSARSARSPGPDNALHFQPANAIKKALGKAGLDRRRPGPDRDQRGVRRGRRSRPCANSASRRTS